VARRRDVFELHAVRWRTRYAPRTALLGGRISRLLLRKRDFEGATAGKLLGELRDVAPRLGVRRVAAFQLRLDTSGRLAYSEVTCALFY